MCSDQITGQLAAGPYPVPYAELLVLLKMSEFGRFRVYRGFGVWGFRVQGLGV